MDELTRVTEAAAVLGAALGTSARVAVVLGSGLGGFADSLTATREIAFHDLPHFPVSTVPGHAARFVVGRFAGADVIAVQGRYHLYEGLPLADVVLPIRVLHRLGVETLVLTNACGAINASFQPGELMAIADHINLTGTNPLVGPNEPAFGPRFPDASAIYDASLRARAADVARQEGIVLREGVYAWWTGPSYETPAEIRMIRALGADAVGMSTVPESLAASHLGMRVLGISCLTNRATGLAEGRLSHADVLAVAGRANAALTRLLEGVLSRIA